MRPSVFRSGRWSAALSSLLIGLAGSPVGAFGQASLSLAAGAAPYDLSGTGTSAIASLRFDVPLTGWLDAQAGPAFFWYTTQGDASVAMLIPEAGLVVTPLRAPLYLSAGVGHTVLVEGEWPEEAVLYVGIGAEIEDRGGWAFRPEVRLHDIDPWAATVVEIAFGVRRNFRGS